MIYRNKDATIPMTSVSELNEGYQVELVCLASENFKWAIKAINEGGNNDTLVDLWELIDWLRFGPCGGRLQRGFCLPLDENCAMED